MEHAEDLIKKWAIINFIDFVTLAI